MPSQQSAAGSAAPGAPRVTARRAWVQKPRRDGKGNRGGGGARGQRRDTGLSDTDGVRQTQEQEETSECTRTDPGEDRQVIFLTSHINSVTKMRGETIGLYLIQPELTV